MPTYPARLMLIESLKADGDVTDVKMNDLSVNECKAVYFTGSSVAVLLCNIGDGMWRVSAKPVPKTVARQYIT